MEVFYVQEGGPVYCRVKVKKSIFFDSHHSVVVEDLPEQARQLHMSFEFESIVLEELDNLQMSEEEQVLQHFD